MLATVSVPAAPGTLIEMLYVIEGATLGGQVIACGLRDNLNLTVSTGTRFFGGYGDEAEIGRRWREFVDYADSLSDGPDQLQCAENAATGIFKLINEQLDDYHSRLAGLLSTVGAMSLRGSNHPAPNGAPLLRQAQAALNQ